jgi:Fe-S-cluster containining protein
MSPCENCHAGCCRSFAIPVTGADIQRIERDLSLDFWNFTCRWADPTGQIAQNHAPQFYFEDDPRTPFVICLTHQKSTFLHGTTKCQFLIEGQPDQDHPLGQARCGIYHQRPATCRVFPTKLNETGELAILNEVPERGRGEEEPAYSLCPTAWKTTDLDPVSTIQNLVIAKFEMSFFHQIAEIWNRTPQSWKVFPDFLRTVYTRRLISESPEKNRETTHSEKIRIPVTNLHDLQRQSIGKMISSDFESRSKNAANVH